MEQISVDRFAKGMFAVLDETFETHHGIFIDKGTSLFETLSDVSAQEASRAAGPKCASIAAHVKHLTLYLNVIEGYVRNQPPGKTDWGEIWRTTREVTTEEWEALQSRLRETHRRVMSGLKSVDNWDEENAIAGALGIAAHTAYHLGAIRQALCAIR